MSYGTPSTIVIKTFNLIAVKTATIRLLCGLVEKYYNKLYFFGQNYYTFFATRHVPTGMFQGDAYRQFRL